MAVDRMNGSEHPESAPESETAEERRDDREGPAAMRQLFAQLEELAEFVHFYIAARSDAIRASVRSALAWTIVALLGLFALTAALVTCAVILVLGVAQIIGESLGDRLWAGYLITGGGTLLVCGLGLWLGVGWFTRRSRQRTYQKYAERREEQRARFGHDVAQRTGENVRG